MAAAIDLSHSTSLDIMSSPEPQQFLKLEDLHNSPSASPAALPTPPPPVVIHSKPAKKRKSWGISLPEPVSNLPPRKRAKTADEKEQRRIERIKRNRAAAHNSRERKRQETETLAVALARANAELEAYRKLHGPLPASIILPEVTISTDEAPESQSCGSVDRQASPVDSLFKSSPRAIKQEPMETSFPIAIPPAFDNLDAKPALSPMSLPLDPTQHSAVSVEPQQLELQQPHQLDKLLVEPSFPFLDDLSHADLLQDSPGSSLDDFAFTDGAFVNTSLNEALDFTFDDFIDESASLPVVA